MSKKLESETPVAAATGCCTLRMPRRETEEWKRLASCLDIIARQVDYPATHQGFCRRKVKVMDAALVQIIRAAEEARSLIQHNNQPSGH